MASLTRNNKDFMLAMLEGNVERELKDIEERIRRLREHVRQVTYLLHESMKGKNGHND